MFDYKKYLPAYISRGNPSEDTIRHYHTEIDNYLEWCSGCGYEALHDVDEFIARQYMRYLIEGGYAEASVNLKLAAVRAFYTVAIAVREIAENPFADIKTKQAAYDDADFVYLTPEEIKEICTSIIGTKRYVDARNLAIIMLMAVEGLRVVEIHRMNDADLNDKTKSILVHGKGHDGFIYPCKATLSALENYKRQRPAQFRDNSGAPTFVSFGKQNFGQRITRGGVRWAINNILEAHGKKPEGKSCHILRHSCGTNLYAATKDLRLVQETLRQKDPATTARYAHVVERIESRATAQISPFADLPIEDF